MGYYMNQQSCTNFLIKSENFDKALAAVKGLAGKGTFPSVDGNHYAWVTDSRYVNAKTLEEAIEAWRWSLELDEKGDAVNLSFEGEKLGDDETLFKTIAPFVDSGELEMSGEDGAIWKWVFKRGQLFEFSGRVVYDEEKAADQGDNCVVL